MRAVVIDGFGGADRVRIAEVPEPIPCGDEVMVEMRYASVNPADWKLREGWLRAGHEPTFPYVLGFDGSGVVVGTGQRVAVKTAVGRGGHGAMAERAAIPAHLLAPLANAVDLVTAATLPCAGITAWEMVFEQGRVAQGQSVLVNGGSGGTGSVCVQLARLAGASVAATGGGANQRYLEALGAIPIDYQSTDVGAAVRRLFPSGVDAILDTVGQGALDRPLDLIRDGGRLITVATLVEAEFRPDAAEAARRGIRVITASTQRDRESAQLRALAAAVADGRLAPPHVEKLPASRAAEAIESLKEGHVRGKLVLDLSQWA